MCKRLKGKEEIGYSRKRKSIRGQMVTVYQDEPRFKKSVLVSAVEGLIKYHEDEIDDLIFAMEHSYNTNYVDFLWEEVQQHYKSLTAIGYWLEDVLQEKEL